MNFDDFDDDLKVDDTKEHHEKEEEKKEDEDINEDINEDIDLQSLEVTEHADAINADLTISNEGEENEEIDLKSLEVTEHVDGLTKVEDKEKSDEAEDDKKLQDKIKERYKDDKENSQESPLYTKKKEAQYKSKKKVEEEESLSLADESIGFGDLEEESVLSEESDLEIKEKTGLSKDEGEDELSYQELEPEELADDLEFEIEDTKSKIETTEETADAITKESKGEQTFADGDATVISSGETFLATDQVHAKLIVKAGKLKRKFFTITEEPMVLGRSIDADITITDTRASRKHAQIYFEDGNYYIKDLGSANGVRINEEKISGKHLLSTQDVIRIGHTKLEFVLIDIEHFEEPQESSQILDFDPDASTKMGTAHIEESSVTDLKLDEKSKIQAEKTEVVGSGTFGGDFTTEESSHINLEEESLLSEEEFQKGFSLKSASKQKPTKVKVDKKAIRLGLLLIFIIGGLMFSMFYEGGETQTPKTDQEEKTQKIVTPESKTGLTADQEVLAKKYYNRARDYYENEQYQNAITEAKRAISVYPNFSQAHDIISYSQEALEDLRIKKEEDQAQAQAEARKKLIEGKLNQADKLLARKKYREALVPIKDVLKYSPNNAEALAMKDEANTGLASRQKITAQRNAARKRMIEQYDVAEKQFSEGDYRNALLSYNRVMVMGRRTSPSLYDKAVKQHAESHKLLMEEFNPVIEEAKMSISNRDFGNALKMLDKLLTNYPSHAEAAKLRSKALEELTLEVKKIYQHSLIMESINDLEEANKGYQQILKIAPTYHMYYKKALSKLKKYN